MNLLWLDLETSGLDPSRHDVLALGIIVTDMRLNEQGRKEWHIRPEHRYFRIQDAKVAEMHVVSGLLRRCETGNHIEDVEAVATGFVRQFEAPRFLAGSSVHFDRSFLAYHMPDLLREFHYRQLDVTTLKLLGENWTKSKAPAKNKAHTPLADLEASIAELRFWRETMFREGVGP